MEQSRRAGGIDVANLFKWNSIMLQLDDVASGGRRHFAEYVHIRARSAVSHMLVGTITILGPGTRVRENKDLPNVVFAHIYCTHCNVVTIGC